MTTATDTTSRALEGATAQYRKLLERVYVEEKLPPNGQRTPETGRYVVAGLPTLKPDVTVGGMNTMLDELVGMLADIGVTLEGSRPSITLHGGAADICMIAKLGIPRVEVLPYVICAIVKTWCIKHREHFVGMQVKAS